MDTTKKEALKKCALILKSKLETSLMDYFKKTNRVESVRLFIFQPYCFYRLNSVKNHSNQLVVKEINPI